ncbi:MAG: class I SAM-dependent methyltransferase [Verrucomicrobiaceae bacterium]|nr:class I SAM-dependent methyltransferase [Verrucomicrobiaceae bacterium]
MKLLHILTIVAALSSTAFSQTPEPGASPAINAKFRDPDLKVDEWAGKFETESREVFAQRRQIVSAMKMAPGMAVADVGAGTGLFTVPMAVGVGKEGKVFAVDISPKFIEHLQVRAKTAGLENIKTVLCTESSTELPAASIDMAFICDTYHHFEHPADTLKSLHAALKPGGRLLLVDFKRIAGQSSDFIMGHVRAGQEVFEAEITAAGFKKTGEESFLKENYFTIFVKVEK